MPRIALAFLLALACSRPEPTTTTIAEGRHAGTEGQNGFGKPGYGGPCPPSGLHHYVFTLYAMADDAPPAQGKAIAQTQLIGTYKK